jgi:hypothetical protein
MKTIPAKMLIEGIMIHDLCIHGFEGPAPVSMPNDGFGNPVQKGEITSSYIVKGLEKKSPKGVRYFDGDCEIPDTDANRTKLHVHVLAGDFDIRDEKLKDEIMANYAPEKGERGSKGWKNPKLYGKPSAKTVRERRAALEAEKQLARLQGQPAASAKLKRATKPSRTEHESARELSKREPAGDETPDQE